MITPIPYTFKYFYSEFVFIYNKKFNILLESLVSSTLTYSSIAELHHDTAHELGLIQFQEKLSTPYMTVLWQPKGGLVLPHLLQQLSQHYVAHAEAQRW